MPGAMKTGAMKIGLVCPYSMAAPGGVQNHVLGLAGYLGAQGHQVRVLAPGRPNRQRLREYGLSADQVDSAGGSIPVPYNGSIARVNFGPLSLTRARRWVRAGDFDLLHLHEPVTPSVSGWALVAADRPVVATFHTATPRSRTMELAGRLLGSTIRKIDAGIAVSDTARHVVVQHLGRDAQVIPNGFRRADFGPVLASGQSSDRAAAGRRATSWRIGDRPRIAFLGRLDEPRKGLDVLLASLPAIRSVHPDLEVIIAGQGHRDLPPGVIVAGQIDDGRRAELLASVDLFVAPHVDRESFGIVLIEAMASGAAVVASDLVPFADLLSGRLDRAAKVSAAIDQLVSSRSDGDAGGLGYLFAAGDAAGLARAVIVALADDRRSLIERAAASTARFDWSVVGEQILDVYRSVLDRSVLDRSGLDRSELELDSGRKGCVELDPVVLTAAQSALRMAAVRPLERRQRAELVEAVRSLLRPESSAAERRIATQRLIVIQDSVGAVSVRTSAPAPVVST